MKVAWTAMGLTLLFGCVGGGDPIPGGQSGIEPPTECTVLGSRVVSDRSEDLAGTTANDVLRGIEGTWTGIAMVDGEAITTTWEVASLDSLNFAEWVDGDGDECGGRLEIGGELSVTEMGSATGFTAPLEARVSTRSPIMFEFSANGAELQIMGEISETGLTGTVAWSLQEQDEHAAGDVTLNR